MLITTRFFPTRPLGRSRAHKVLERDVLVYRRNWTIIVSGFFEPVFYLLGIGFGLGTLVGDVGDIPYAAFVAPGLMATTAMNGALFEVDLQPLLQAQVRQDLRRHPVHAAGAVRRRHRRGQLVADTGPALRHRLPRGDAGCWGWCSRRAGILAIPGALLIGLAAASVGHGRHARSCASGRTSTWSPW